MRESKAKELRMIARQHTTGRPLKVYRVIQHPPRFIEMPPGFIPRHFRLNTDQVVLDLTCTHGLYRLIKREIRRGQTLGAIAN